MSIINIDGNIGLEIDNINAATNALSRVVGGQGSQLLVSILRGLERYAVAKSNVIKHGNLANFADFISGDFGEDTIIMRRDPHSWLINIDLRCDDGSYAFINASRSVISVIFEDPEKCIVLSENKINSDDIMKAAYENMRRMSKISALRNRDAAVVQHIALISGRVYDSMQSLIHLKGFIDNRVLRNNFEVITVRGASLLDDAIVHEFLNIKCRDISQSDFHRLKQAANVDVIASMDWHWSSKSPANIESFRDLFHTKSSNTVKTKTVFVALDLEKRIWLEQEETLFQAISILQDKFSFERILLNGMTRPPGLVPGAPFFEEVKSKEIEFISSLKERFPGMEVIHLHGTTIAEKISAVAECSYFISPAGSAALFPLILSVPGVAFGTQEFLHASKNLIPSNDTSLALLDPKLVKTIKVDMSVMKYSWSTASPQGMSYSIEKDSFLQTFQKHAHETLWDH